MKFQDLLGLTLKAKFQTDIMKYKLAGIGEQYYFGSLAAEVGRHTYHKDPNKNVFQGIIIEFHDGNDLHRQPLQNILDAEEFSIGGRNYLRLYGITDGLRELYEDTAKSGFLDPVIRDTVVTNAWLTVPVD